MSSIMKGIVDETELDENLHKWFKEKWVRFGPDGKIRGACARGDDSEGKPKCLPQKKAQNLGKKGRKYAASKKRREDPNPERTGKAKNVATKKNTNEGVPFDECPKCRGPIVHESMMNEKQDACYHKVKSRYKVWPSAYASGALVQCRKKGASNWGTGKKTESSIMKGIVNEEEYVLVLYVDGKPLAKYGADQEAKKTMERLKAKFPNKTIELKREVRGGIGGNEKVDEAGSPAQQAAIAINMKKRGEKPKHVDEAKAKQYVKPYNDPQTGEQIGWVSSDGYHKKYWQKFAKASAIKHAKLNPDEVQEDYTGEFAAEKTPAINPYGGLEDNKFRGAISEGITAALNEMPETSGPIGTQPGGWRKYSPKPAGEIDEDTSYGGGMGQGGNAGQSYRKFKPKSAGTFKEEEQLDEKCWDTHKQVGMKKKGGKEVPNCVPKESAIMKGLKR
jgi:hypothetical protein